MTEQEVSECIVEECRLREELGEKNEISKRQVFVCMGPIYNELLDDAVLEELEATFNEDETFKQIKRSDRIKEKAEKDTVFDILNKGRGRKWSNLSRCSFSESDENVIPKSLEHEFVPIKMRYKRNRIVSPLSTSTVSTGSNMLLDDLQVDLGLIDNPGDGLKPLDKMFPKKVTGKKTFQKKSDLEPPKEETLDESEEDVHDKCSCKASLDLGVTLPDNDEETDQELASIMEENPDVTKDDVSAAKVLVRLHSSRSSLAQSDTGETEK